MPQPKDIKSIYINKDLHKKVKLHCLKHDLGPMIGWIEGILEVAVEKPKRSDRLQKLRDEAEEDGLDLRDPKRHKLVIEAPVGLIPKTDVPSYKTPPTVGGGIHEEPPVTVEETETPIQKIIL